MTTDNNAPPPKSGIKRTSYKSATYRGDGIAVTSDINGRRRARKACENCRSKKTKVFDHLYLRTHIIALRTRN